MKAVRHLLIFIAVLACCCVTGCATTPLFEATMSNDLESVQALVARGDDVNAETEYGLSPLATAAYNGYVPIATVLLDHGAKPDLSNGWNTPLVAAIQEEKTEMVSLLVTRGANVNYATPNTGRTPLMICAQYGNAAIARMLLAAGADMTVRHEDGKTALSIALDKKKLDVLGVFRKAGAQVPYSGKASDDIVIAVVSGDREKVHALVTAGVDPNAEIEADRHLLIYAVEWKWPEVVLLLVKKGADVKAQDSDGWTPMMHAARDNQETIMKAFADAGVKMPYSGEAKKDVLLAVLEGDRGKVAALLAAGADVNSLYRFNSPLLNYAANKKDLAMSILLLDSKANPNLANFYGFSPFIIALTNKDLPMIKAMLDRGADVNSKGTTGFSALMYAIAYTDVTTVKELLSRGAQPDPYAVSLSQGGNASFKKVNMPEITALLKPDVLRRQMLRAQAAVETAQSPADFQSAMQEYELAKLVAPESAEIYYNLGLVQEKAGAYGEAIRNLREYLRLASTASDTQAVKDMIYKLEYKRDQEARTR